MRLFAAVGLRSRGKALFGMRENGESLLARHAGKPLEKILHGSAAFEILEQSTNRNAGFFEDPGAAHAVRVTFHRRASVPIEHGQRLAVSYCGSKSRTALPLLSEDPRQR